MTPDEIKAHKKMIRRAYAIKNPQSHIAGTADFLMKLLTPGSQAQNPEPVLAEPLSKKNPPLPT